MADMIQRANMRTVHELADQADVTARYDAVLATLDGDPQPK